MAYDFCARYTYKPAHDIRRRETSRVLAPPHPPPCRRGVILLQQLPPPPTLPPSRSEPLAQPKARAPRRARQTLRAPSDVGFRNRFSNITSGHYAIKIAKVARTTEQWYWKWNSIEKTNALPIRLPCPRGEGRASRSYKAQKRRQASR